MNMMMAESSDKLLFGHVPTLSIVIVYEASIAIVNRSTKDLASFIPKMFIKSCFVLAQYYEKSDALMLAKPTRNIKITTRNKKKEHRNISDKIVLLFLISVVTFLAPGTNANESFEDAATRYLEDLDKKYSEACHKHVSTSWEHATNVNDETFKAATEAGTEFMNFQRLVQHEILERFPNWTELKDENLRRQFKHLSTSGPANMSQSDVADMNHLIGKMEAEYSTATVCEYMNPTNCTMRLDQEITSVFETSQDPDELAHYWTAWHDKLSEIVPPEKYQRYLAYSDTYAKANGFKNMADMWLAGYDDGTPEWSAEKFKEEMMEHWKELKPMYEVLHAYFRMKLRKMPGYGELIDECGYIPIHITGNLYAQNWAATDFFTKPFPDAPSLDATRAMWEQNYTVEKMFEEANQFFIGLGLPPMTETFWKKSMIKRPEDGRLVICHGSAEDFCLGNGNEDFRISMCARVNMEDLFVIHHEMGHIAYFQQYVNQPLIYRAGANSGFHEAIGDALALAVSTPRHLECYLNLQMDLNISCINNSEGIQHNNAEVTEIDLNYLYFQAIQKILVFPSSISLETWRWEAFEGKLTPDQYNTRWWQKHAENLGVKPPSPRLSPNLFDPAAKYHIVDDVEYLRYFVAHILQFQFYEAMCIAAGEFDPHNKDSKPLYQCDFSGSKKAGELLGSTMKLGFSKPWPDALEKFTGSRKMSTSSLNNYMKPLIDFMQKELDASGEKVGWGPGYSDSCKS